jgi:hypothetical protein
LVGTVENCDRRFVSTLSTKALTISTCFSAMIYAVFGIGPGFTPYSE